jgi:hypothetical protein
MGYPVASTTIRSVSDEAVRPRAGVDYPATWPEFESWFPDEEACRRYLARLRWPEGFRCPNCGGREAWETNRALWKCAACGHQTSVTAGTIFHRSRYPLRTWFAAAWFVCSQKTGASALGLKRVLGLGSYETAWTWMHKLRRAMVRPDRDQLGGPGVIVELDETFIGGRSGVGKRGRYENKATVVIAVERRQPKGLGRVRMRQVPDHRKDEVLAFAQECIAPGSIVYTDGATMYKQRPALAGVIHEPIILTSSKDPAHVVLPGVHRVASLLDRWLAGTLHYGQKAPCLDYYLDEYTFRFNRRASGSRGMLFYRLLQQAANTDPHPLDDLVADAHSGEWS